MIKLTASNPAEAIEVCKALCTAAHSIHHDPELHEIEQTALINTLCRIRDNVEIKEEPA